MTKSLRNSDDDLSCGALHHGWGMGRLQFDDHYSRMLLLLVKPISQTTVPTALGLLHLCKVWQMDILFCPIPSEIISSDDIRTGPLTPNFQNLKKQKAAVKAQIEGFISNKGKTQWTITTENWVKSCGTNVACPATKKD